MEPRAKTKRPATLGALPSGTVAFLFTDIEGSTQRWETHRDAMRDAVAAHDALMRATIEAHEGYVFKTIGDAFCAAFSTAPRAIGAALAAQRALAENNFSAIGGMRVRMAVHAGHSDEREGDYFGPAVNRVARLLAIGHGGQILISSSAKELIERSLPAKSSLRDLGAHRLKDLTAPEQVYQLVAPGLADDFAPLRSLDALPHNLPLQVTSFVGRSDEIAHVQALLAKHRAVTLTGAGGVGKTRLSLQVAADLLDGYPDGVWFVDLGSITDPHLVPSSLATLIGVQGTGDRPLTQTLVAALRRKKCFVIFDGCEHVLEAAADLVSALVRVCPDVRVLATSRQALDIAGEQIYRLASLRIPDADGKLDAERALSYEAIALFADRALLATNSFAVTDENAGTVARICRRLDGIALAIELAAPRLQMLSLDQLDDRLTERFRLLTGGSRDALPRQQTMRALIDWSYDLLDDDERRLFDRLCVFAGDFSLEAANAVAGAEAADEWRVFELLSSLVAKSLVATEPRGAILRYRLLESMRAYALEKASARGEVEGLRRRHAEHFAAVARRARDSWSAVPENAWASQLDPDLEQFTAALDWALGGGDEELGLHLLASLRRFWTGRGLGSNALRRAEAALAHEARLPAEAQIALWLTLAETRMELFQTRRCFEAASRARDLSEALGDRRGLAEALRLRGAASTRTDAPAGGEADLRRALDLFRDLGDRLMVARTMGNLAHGLMSSGRFEEARGAFIEVLEMARSTADQRLINITMLNLAEIEFARGDPEAAVARARENLSSDALRKDTSLRINQKSNLGVYLLALNRVDEARAAGLDALALARDIEDHVYGAIVLNLLALVVASSAPKQAARLLGYVESVFADHGVVREFTERFAYERLMATLRTSMSEDEIVALGRQGAGMSDDEAVELVRQA